MMDLAKERNINTIELTPIEIALGIDSEGKTTATKLYDFLGLNPSNYTKWCKVNIIENEFAEENVDYFPFVLEYESIAGLKTRQDFKLTASFAKKLSMTQKNQKGEEARKYFVGIEEIGKTVAMNFQKLSPELQFMIKVDLKQQEHDRAIIETNHAITETQQRMNRLWSRLMPTPLVPVLLPDF